MREIPASLQTTYANLLQAHLNQPHFEFDGAPFTMEKRGKLYWYVNQRGVGASPPRQRYLGPYVMHRPDQRLRLLHVLSRLCA